MKTFIDYNTVRNNALLLANKIYKKDNFTPDIIYASLRGGAYMANAISEYYKAVNKKVIYAAVVAHSYIGINNKETNINIEGWTYDIDKLPLNSKIMIVDDIYDSGATITSLVNLFLKKGFSRDNIKVVVHDYKNFIDANNNVIPDYFCIKHDIKSSADNKWIHYKSHELIGLTDDEINEYYIKDYPELKPVFESIRTSQTSVF